MKKMDYRIIPINVGEFEALPKQTCMYRMYREVTFRAPCIIWHIAGSRDNIIVDLGPDPQLSVENHGLAVHRSEEQEPVRALERTGLRPEDVKLVIMTHLHWDHACGFHLFPEARFLVQRKEAQYAIAPLPCHTGMYHEKSHGKPQFVDYLPRIDLIDGDREVEKGINAVFLPGHSPGFQGVSVNTSSGKYLIAGDAVGLYECWETIPHVPSGIFNNLEDCYRSMEKIEETADVVLPGHDPGIFDQEVYP